MRLERAMEPICMGSNRVGDMVGDGGVDCFLLYRLEEEEEEDDNVGKNGEI